MTDTVSNRTFGRKIAQSTSNAPTPPQYSTFVDTATLVTDDGLESSKGHLGFNLLYSPSEPLIDLIFVHGLGGGSRKTWSKTSSITHYWPQEWLPKDPAFKRVRIHSFGYNSDWIKGGDNCLNIHHFGKSLLGEMSTSPCVGDADKPMVLVGHSMGGLVIKKAYMLARQDKAYETLSKRFHTVYFLATPHRGSDSAKLLNGILQAAYSSRAYVGDLKRSSSAIQAINNEFRGIFSRFIVDPDSATLGYPDEKQMPMNCDHRSICKFDTVADPNYRIIRNALASTVNGISNTVLESKEKLCHSQMKELRRYLGVSDNLEDDLNAAEDARMSGTCTWLSKKIAYLEWKNFTVDAPRILWINGRPASGKSILASYVIDDLKSANMSCSYFFFRYGDKSKSRLCSCLRSMAFQMARTNAQIRETLLEILNDDIMFDMDNERTVWRRFFLSGIFRTEFSNHYWIIDALDECVDFSTIFDVMFGKLDELIPLRILITSRETPLLKKGFTALGKNLFQTERISTVDTLPDIKLLVGSMAKSLAVKDDDCRTVLAEKIVEKSKGSFLWTVLVLKELGNCHSEREIDQVLDNMPRGMESLYHRTLELMSQATRGKELAHAILNWTTCAMRPLTIGELEGALKLDVKDNLLKLREAITALCGQLVNVDKYGTVQMTHETAREFLLSNGLESEFAINKTNAHTRIARTCLIHLIGEEMKPPRSGKRVSAMCVTRKRTDFSVYACETFSYHLAKADPLANDVLSLVNKFLKSNVLSWIEVIAQTRDLTALIRTAKHLRMYHNSCSAERSPLGNEIQTIRGWTTDLIRIAAKFADPLIMLPSAIYSLVLPFCPSESMAYLTQTSGRRLSVVGLTNSQWDDRLSCVDFRQGQTSAVCYGDEFLAIGLSKGTVTLYHATSCQEYSTLNHGEAVKILLFKNKSDLMASCGIKFIRIWDIRSGQMIHCFELQQRCICLAFDNNLLIGATHKNYFVSWDLGNDGVQQPDRPWKDSGESNDTELRRQPCAISISISHKMLAVAYSGQPISLWDIEDDTFYGTCGKKLPSGESSTHLVSALVFNPNVNIDLLAASYLDGDLVLIDPFRDQELGNLRPNCHTLAASADGRLLAGGAGFGTIQIYEFDTLRLLYVVKSSDLYIKQLAFSKDSLQFVDIRGSQCNIWEPMVLLRDLVDDDTSESTSNSVFEAVALNAKLKINAMILHPNGEVIFCGKDDGSVSLYNVKTGIQLRTLYQHKSLVRILTWWPQRNVIMSVDASNCILTCKLEKSKHDEWVTENSSFQSRLDCGKSIIQVLAGEAAGKFILSTRESDHLWSMNGLEIEKRTYSQISGTRKWIQHLQSSPHMICIESAAARIYSWNDWSEIISIPLALDINALQLKSVTPFKLYRKHQILLELSELDGSAQTHSIYLIDAASFNITSDPAKKNFNEVSKLQKDTRKVLIKEETTMIPDSSPILGQQSAALAVLAEHVTHIIGTDDTGKLCFLDTQSWICSADLETLSTSSISYIRHFFVPYDWFSGTRDVICALTKGAICLARNDNVAIIKGWLDYSERVDLVVNIGEAKGTRTLLLKSEKGTK